MIRIEVPYGKRRISAEIAEQNYLGTFASRIPEAAADEGAAVEEALDHPIGSPKLEDLAKNKRSAVIITSDHTRPVPSRIIMPRILERLRRGSPGIDITILVATGFHRGTTREELMAKLGEEIVEQEKIVVHDSSDAASLVRLGTRRRTDRKQAGGGDGSSRRGRFHRAALFCRFFRGTEKRSAGDRLAPDRPCQPLFRIHPQPVCTDRKSEGQSDPPRHAVCGGTGKTGIYRQRGH